MCPASHDKAATLTAVAPAGLVPMQPGCRAARRERRLATGTVPLVVRSRSSRLVSTVVAIVSVVAVILVALSEIGADLSGTVANIAAAFWIVGGAVLVRRLPRHLVGWLLWLGGVALAISLGTGGFATYGLTGHPGAVPGAIWLAWVSAWTGVPSLFIAAGFLPLVYPSGHLVSGRWRPAALLGVLAVVLVSLGDAFGPFTTDYGPGVQNPLLATGPAANVLVALVPVQSLAGLAFLASAVTSIVVRFRRSSGVERQQLKYFAYMAFIVTAGLLAALVTSSAVAWLVVLAGLALMPVAIGIAVLRYRLYDIDLVIRRTMVYVPLTAALAGLYAATTALLQRLFIDLTGNPSDGAVVLSTLVLAATFTPIRAAFQGFVDRRFKDGEDAERRIARFADHVATGLWEPNPARVLQAFLTEAMAAFGSAGGLAYVSISDGERLVGQSAERGAGPPLVIVVAAAGRPFGRIELDARTNGRPYGEGDIGVLRASGERIAAALMDPGALRVVGATRSRAKSAAAERRSADRALPQPEPE